MTQAQSTGNRPDPRLKKWYLVQFGGGCIAGFGILASTYVVARSVEAGKGLIVPQEQLLLLLLGLAAHIAGRIGARRLR